MRKRASKGKAPSEAWLFPVCGLFCGQRRKPKFKPAKIVEKASKTTAFRLKSGCFVELLPRFELGTSSLPTAKRRSIACCAVLSWHFCTRSMRPCQLLCPLNPCDDFPVWVGVWVKAEKKSNANLLYIHSLLFKLSQMHETSFIFPATHTPEDWGRDARGRPASVG